MKSTAVRATGGLHVSDLHDSLVRPHVNQGTPMTAKTMPALVKRERKEGLWLDEVQVPAIGVNDVLIEVLRTGICGTDVHIYNGDAWAQKTIPVPMVVGHEFVGRIVAVGSNVRDFH